MTDDSAFVAQRIRALEDSNRRLERLVYDMAEALARMAGERDPFVRAHELNVAHLARAIANEMGLSAQDVEDISMAGLLCDIGKFHVPEEVLANPGKLSDAEYEQMKEHVAHASGLLAGVEFPGGVALIVKQHHERMDGSGYPQGLSGADIVVGARVLGVADVVEAMLSDRPHRPAPGMDAAVEEITTHAERYDADVVAACLRVLR